MRLFVGEKGPITGVQSFEFNGTQAVDRNGEYDSEEQIIDVAVPEYTGSVEFLDNERTDFYQALIGLNAATLVDIDLTAFGKPPMTLNVWNPKKTRFIKGSLVMKPVFTNHPLPTTLNDPTRLRFEFSSPRCVASKKYAVALDAYDGNGVSTVFSLTRTAKQLSWVFGGRFVISVVLVETFSNGAQEFTEAVITSTTSSSFTLQTAPASGVRVLAYYFYESTGEAVGYQGGTT